MPEDDIEKQHGSVPGSNNSRRDGSGSAGDGVGRQASSAVDGDELFGASWLESLTEALNGLEIPEAVDGVVQIKVSNRIRGGPLLFRVAMEAGRASVAAGRFRNADAVLTWKYDDFAAVWHGELSLEEAYMTGQMKLEGDRVLLIDGWRPLRTSSKLHAALRAVHEEHEK